MPCAEVGLGSSAWELAASAPGEEPADGAWLPALVPGTVAGALRAAGATAPGDLDELDWTYRAAFDAAPAAPGEEVVLHLGGLATLAEVRLNGTLVVSSSSMWEQHAADVGGLLRDDGPNAIELRFAALGPQLRRRRRPRARWRTPLADTGLRFHRTLLLGRTPGIAPRCPAVGPWRPLVLRRRSGVVLEALVVRPRLDGDAGVVEVAGVLRAVAGSLPTAATVVLEGPSGRASAELEVAADGAVCGEVRLAAVDRWWPATHGAPTLHEVTLSADGRELARRRVGFRTLRAGPRATWDVERDGLDVHLNGTRCFLRGAVWTPPDLVGLVPAAGVVRERLERMAAAGLNVVRVGGLGPYEDDAFHDACDELGLLVWQDLAVARLDLPLADDAFAATMRRETADVVARLTGRPSTLVVCGDSEVAQSAAMLGLAPGLGRSALGTELLPAAVAAAGCDVVVVPSAPCGGDPPFRTDVGVASYFGVGGYERGLDDVRRAAVRFAAECLALSHLPSPGVLAQVGLCAGVVADAGATWDFADVRDHYLRRLHGVEPADLRRGDVERYVALSRAVEDELVAEVLGEWRRAGSGCGGAIVLALADLEPGSGWGLLDDRGRPKPVWGALARACAPVSAWTTDEGLNGLAVHVANDRPEALAATLRLRLHRADGSVLEEGAEVLDVPPRTTVERRADALLGRWLDLDDAYRFGPPAHESVVVELLGAGGEPLATVVRLPGARRPAPRSAAELGAQVELLEAPAGGPVVLVVRAQRLLHRVRITADGHVAREEGLDVPPGAERRVTLDAVDGAPWAGGTLTALTLTGSIACPVAR